MESRFGVLVKVDGCRGRVPPRYHFDKCHVQNIVHAATADDYLDRLRGVKMSAISAAIRGVRLSTLLAYVSHAYMVYCTRRCLQMLIIREPFYDYDSIRSGSTTHS